MYFSSMVKSTTTVRRTKTVNTIQARLLDQSTPIAMHQNPHRSNDQDLNVEEPRQHQEDTRDPQEIHKMTQQTQI